MKYLVWLQAVLKEGSNKALELLEHFENAENIYKYRNDKLKSLNILSPA